MDEKRKTALLRGAMKLVEMNTPEEEMITTLQELGLKNEEAKGLIEEAKTLVKREPEARKTEEAPEDLSTLIAQDKKEQKPKPGTPFWKKIFPIGRDYLPKLRTGGRAKVKEIFVESPLDKNN